MTRIKPDLPIIAFPSQETWDAWLAGQPATSAGLWLKLAFPELVDRMVLRAVKKD